MPELWFWIVSVMMVAYVVLDGLQGRVRARRAVLQPAVGEGD